MTELQWVEFEMLKEFVRICEQLGLKYFLVCGSALGAVKYNGFIPWDDDIDVALPRPDYEIFCEKAQLMLPKYLFLQNYKTDSHYPLFMSKIRDSRTTFVEPLYKKLPMHHGIYIDVFPLDGYPTDAFRMLWFERRKRLFNRCRAVHFSYNRTLHPRAILYLFLHKVLGLWKDISKIVERFDKIASSYSCEQSEIWCNHGNWQGKLEYADKSQYGEGIEATFEGLKVRIPENYDAYLTQKYGDWRTDLPEDKKNAPHRAMILDLERPYTDYM